MKRKVEESREGGKAKDTNRKGDERKGEEMKTKERFRQKIK